MAFDQREFRNALGCFATGVTIVTALDPRNKLLGITANSFSAVSLDPPLVLFSLDRRAHSLRAFLSTKHFAVNVLSAEQAALATAFARPLSDKWTGVEYEIWDTDCPIIKGALAQFECEIQHTYEGGDHIIFVGAVLRMAYHPEREPLIFYRGRYRSLRVPDEEPGPWPPPGTAT